MDNIIEEFCGVIVAGVFLVQVISTFATVLGQVSV